MQFKTQMTNSSVKFVKGQQIIDAAVEGAKRGYNRSTDDQTQYENALSSYFQEQLKGCSRAERRSVIKKTKGDWRRAYLPIEIAQEHRMKGGVPCEPHARVFLPPYMGAAFDIPLEFWEGFVNSNPRIRG